ncbi:SusC/RagA family TonB-linked outer membrane protein [Flammeovirga kamogawensis]|uniref:TonB-dependent receptor n=1 Tax=Flammeovirga kamogawensis TaxID=373891 RepID=A0ABX8H1Q4_9BACT|nr:TonB-dependent receptor [Flammeovirga kamogawensis]MBB6462622.1 TonB-linked SusC/RagA family outer membrane protein [Flammeovirga kamogawensis]QWG09633.1 TonB-dependent receptor [Flammeovirga kamogawensis]TRX65147.1 TonB-dependent receptor [Flammeovirga kamogawensis]
MKQSLLFILLLLPSLLFAQHRMVNGTVVTSDDSMPLPGCNVTIKGVTKGTITDIDGKFSLLVNDTDVLIFSFIGMASQEVVVKGKTNLSIKMEFDAQQLDEIEVSAGYFDIKKSDITGSITQVGAETLEQSRTTSVENMLSGRVAGVVVSNSGEPGGGVGISIRGTNSMLGGTQPLYVVDGIPIEPLQDAQGNSGAGASQSSLSFLNPNDIQSISVLKDASATALYGARGANGVVVITTKEAKGGKSYDKITGSVEIGISQVANRVDVLDGPGYESFINQKHINEFYRSITNPARDGMVFDGSQELTPENFPEVALLPNQIPYLQSTGVNTNWQDEVFQPAISKNYNLAYRGGTKKGNISLSFGLLDNEGVIVNSDFTRATLNMNVRREMFNGKVTLQSKTNGSYGSGRATSSGNGQFFSDKGVVTNTLTFQPIYAKLEDGQTDDLYAGLNEGQLLSNPYTMATEVQDNKEALTIAQSFILSTDFTDNLSGTVKGAVNYQNSQRQSFYPITTARGRRNNGEASRSSLSNTKLYSEVNLRYQNTFGLHHIDVVGLGTIENRSVESNFNKAFGFPVSQTSYYTFENATDILVPVTNYFDQSMLSGLLRVAYNFNSKYFIDANARIDASSKFSENNKSGLFPAVALAWAVSEESFLKSSDKVNNLKLRASYGKTGNNAIAAYQSMGLMEPVRYNFDGSVAVGYVESNLNNSDLTWETTDQANVGFDLSMFNSRLYVTVDAYYKLTHDLLQNVNLPVSNGYISKVDNFGEVENKGVELTVGYDVISKKDFKWNLTGTFGVNRNKLVSLNNNIEYQLGPKVGPDKVYPSMFMEGKPLGIFWGAETNGIYSDWAQVEQDKMPSAYPGEIRYVNHDAVYDDAGNLADNQQINFDDYVQIGDPNPDFNYSLNSSMNYKNWDFSFLITGQQGGDILWVESWSLDNMGKQFNARTEAFNNAWKAPISIDAEGNPSYTPSIGNTTNAGYPAPVRVSGQRAIASDRQVYDGSYIKLKSMNIGYTLPIQGKKRSIRFYAAGNNLFTITDYPGFDPEVQTYNQNPQRRGIDFGSYPGTRSYIFGLKFNY